MLPHGQGDLTHDIMSSCRNVHRQTAISTEQFTRIYPKLRHTKNVSPPELQFQPQAQCNVLAWSPFGPLSEATTYKFIIISIDTFIRYVKLVPKNTVSIRSVGNTLWQYLSILFVISDIRSRLKIVVSREDGTIQTIHINCCNVVFILIFSDMLCIDLYMID